MLPEGFCEAVPIAPTYPGDNWPGIKGMNGDEGDEG